MRVPGACFGSRALLAHHSLVRGARRGLLLHGGGHGARGGRRGSAGGQFFFVSPPLGPFASRVVPSLVKSIQTQNAYVSQNDTYRKNATRVAKCPRPPPPRTVGASEPSITMTKLSRGMGRCSPRRSRNPPPEPQWIVSLISCSRHFVSRSNSGL
jgi:hypothetical protein